MAKRAQPQPHPLLTRDQFRDAVWARDGHQCVVCQQPAIDAHHILERRLWPDGGYYLDNGVSVCEVHHMEAEETAISCEQLRELAGIEDFPLPEHLSSDEVYDKWGNPVLPNGQRLKGELFWETPVQKILGSRLALFGDRVKYPRTYHLPWSPGITNDDRIQKDLSFLEGADEVVVTVKQDGENTTMYRDYLHARSVEYEPHPSRSWVKALHAGIAGDIPSGWRLCGENLYAQHSIQYANLTGYFQVFSIWDDKNICLSWDDTVEWSGLLGLPVVPVLYRGPWDEDLIKDLHKPNLAGDPCEGYVVRDVASFPYREFRRRVAKYVRKQHVQTGDHWLRGPVVANGCR